MQAKMKSRFMLIASALGLIFLSFSAGLIGTVFGGRINQNLSQNTTLGNGTITNLTITNEDSPITQVAETASKSVVSIVVSKELSRYQNYDPFDFLFPGETETEQSEPELQQVGAGTGFIVTKDGLIVTNRHVVDDEDANYTVVLNDGTQLEAKVIGRDSILDIAIVKVESATELPVLKFGDSSKLKVGQTVVAIGNSLGEFSNTVSSGIISGLSRSIIAGGNMNDQERLDGVLQTDASINPGNSGGPLLDLSGNVIGVNVAVARDAENIGFAIPINSVVQVVNSVIEFGEIVRPYLGIRYQNLTESIAKEANLPVSKGAWIVPNGNRSEGPAILPNSPAAKAGLRAGDIILKVNGVELSESIPLQSELQKYKVNDEITLSILRGESTQEVKVKLEKRPS